MPCNSEEINLIDLNFTSTDDGGNWFTDSTTPITTISGKMKLKAQNRATKFSRPIGLISADKDRIHLKSNLEVFRPQTSISKIICVDFAIYLGVNKIDSFTIYADDLNNGERLNFFFDRQYKYSGLNGSITLEITFPQGFENELFLKDLNVSNEKNCTDGVITYFSLKDVLAESFNARSVGIDLKEYKVNGVETLTTEFYNERSGSIGGSADGWYFAKAALDGSNRVQEIVQPNTFNIFARDCGLIYPDGYHGGKPTGTISGSNYGAGILNIGYSNPEVLNNDLLSQKGVFFVDINYDEDLKIVFDVIVNNTSTSLYNSPLIYRTYTIEVNTANCTQEFYYNDVLNNGAKTDQLINGFLSGISGSNSTQENLGCGEVVSYKGRGGDTILTVDFGTATGDAGIKHNAINTPANFVIEWGGNLFDTGYIGSLDYDQDLINAGVLPGEIFTDFPPNGEDTLIFSKNTAYPTTATITIKSPLDDTNWEIQTICPSANTSPIAQIGFGSCSIIPSSSINVYFDTSDISSYNVKNGDIVYRDSSMLNRFDGAGKTFRFRVSAASLWGGNEFQISPTGVVSGVTACDDSGVITIDNSKDSGCQSIWSIVVVVPSGQTRRVEFSGRFGGSANFSRTTSLLPYPINVFDDLVEDITANKRYTFGINGSQHGPDGLLSSSMVAVSVKDAVTNSVLGIDEFYRSHSESKLCK
ncbi:MAG: hypothetical protein ACPGRW_06295 [Flavobacteriaceae bacterium]